MCVLPPPCLFAFLSMASFEGGKGGGENEGEVSEGARQR